MLKKLLLVIFVIGLVVAGILLAIGSKTMANVSYQSYQTATYSYDVELDTVYDSKSDMHAENGILVSVSPQRETEDAAGFSDAYYRASWERAQQWATERRTGLADVMLIFAHPLTLEEANHILDPIKANVFESGFVGYVDGTPFAGYLKEEGRLSHTLQECAKLGGYGVGPDGVVPEMTENDVDKSAGDYDVRGYLAVRAWIDLANLDSLRHHQDVLLVDTTPQDVRDQLSENPTWQGKVIRAVALEMPVWDYRWE